MRTVCIAVLAVLLAVTVGCCFFTVKKKSEYSAAILRLLVSGIVTGIFTGLCAQLVSKRARQAGLFSK